ncbi:hypothetical protein ACK6D9_12135 [Hoeflea sp. Naph1]|uniref:hypothetical protein n=1 Tax=Hoeflea sp. Naph1 TaxID=3388653 RepID=UPI0039900846
MPMSLCTPKTLLFLAGLIPALANPSLAQDIEGVAESLSERVLFVTSGGAWEEAVNPGPDETGETSDGKAAEPQIKDEGQAPDNANPDVAEATPPTAPQRGYYRLVALRGPDNRSLLHLQQIALTGDGPELVLSIEVEEINALGAYVTDIRPEDSTGAASQPGFAAYIYLKTDPTMVEPETWALYVDEFGDIVVEKTSN